MALDGVSGRLSPPLPGAEKGRGADLIGEHTDVISTTSLLGPLPGEKECRYRGVFLAPGKVGYGIKIPLNSKYRSVTFMCILPQPPRVTSSQTRSTKDGPRALGLRSPSLECATPSAWAGLEGACTPPAAQCGVAGRWPVGGRHRGPGPAGEGQGKAERGEGRGGQRGPLEGSSQGSRGTRSEAAREPTADPSSTQPSAPSLATWPGSSGDSPINLLGISCLSINCLAGRS